MNEKDTRALPDYCTKGAETGPQTIIVRQVIGEVEKQKVLDIHVTVPAAKPPIEQIVDVFVKDVEVNCVDVITDKVIVRGEFEIKAIYVACLPDQPVHAVEIKHYKWSQDIVVPGARRGMDADASVVVEFVDYDVDEMCRAYKYKNCEMDDEDDDEEAAAEETPHHCHNDHHGCHHGGHGDCHHHCHHHEDECTREFDVSVVLKITAKVMTDRQIQINPAGTVPAQPKG